MIVFLKEKSGGNHIHKFFGAGVSFPQFCGWCSVWKIPITKSIPPRYSNHVLASIHFHFTFFQDRQPPCSVPGRAEPAERHRRADGEEDRSVEHFRTNLEKKLQFPP